MDKEAKKVLKIVIDNKFYEILERFPRNMTEEEKAEYENVNYKINKLEQELKRTLSHEQRKLFLEHSDAAKHLSCIRETHMFYQGLRMGFEDLSFIGEERWNEELWNSEIK